jgi:murein DD-endopeptidase MepM/ murein hydrolase activator NlpD
MRIRVPPIGLFLGIGGLIGLGFVFMRPSAERIPDAGLLAPLHVAPAETMEVQHLRSGQTFGQILQAASLGPAEQHELLLVFQEHSNPRRMRPGTEISLRRRAADGWLRGVDVQVNADQTLRMARDESGWSSDLIETPFWTDTIYSSGEIVTDLWSAMVGNPDLEKIRREDRYQLIDHLDKVFQWQVDFSRQIREGDYYRMVFERQVRPDGSLRGGHILAAELVNQGRSLHAVRFHPEGGNPSYYDLEGNSVRRAFLTRPLEFRRISSRFNNARFHPVLRTRRPHNGVDYAAATGTPIQTTGDGTIVKRGWDGGYGNMVEIRHANGYVTRYAHLNGFRAGQRVGSRVQQGEVIGYVGMTGLATGPHLHYEMHRNGVPMDPLNVRLPAGDPIPASDRDRWEAERVQRSALLMVLPAPPGTKFASSGGTAPEASRESEGGR